MNRSELRVPVAANQPTASETPAGGLNSQAANTAAAMPPQVDPFAMPPAVPNPPWLVRNSRKAIAGLVLALFVASPFVYKYLYSVFGPDPLAGVKIDKGRAAAITGLSDTSTPVDVKSAETKPVSAFKPVEPAPAPLPQSALALPPTAAGSPAAAIPPVALPMGVTHTRPGGAPPAATAANIEVRAAPVAPAREQQATPAVANNCSEATEVLGLCNPTTTKGR